MQVGSTLEFSCTQCQHNVQFSIVDSNAQENPIKCASCGKDYVFDSNSLEQLKLFSALCRQISESSSILSQACVAVDIGGQQVKIPFNILLTRLNSLLNMDIEGVHREIAFRIEPIEELNHLP